MPPLVIVFDCRSFLFVGYAAPPNDQTRQRRVYGMASRKKGEGEEINLWE